MVLDHISGYAKANNIPIIRKRTRKFLSLLLLAQLPRKILEIGTACGYSSLFFLNELRNEVLIDTIEISQDMTFLARKNFKIHDISGNINLIHGDALLVLPYLVQMKNKYDFIFMDASKNQYRHMFSDCCKMLSEDGIIVCDNVSYHDMVWNKDYRGHKHRTAVKSLRTFLKEIKEYKGVDYAFLPIEDGILVIFHSE